MKILKKTICVALLLAFVCTNAFAEDKGISLDFENVEIKTFIKYISEATGHNFIPDPNVKGNVTVYSPVKISKDEAFETFVSIMRVHGYAVQKSGANWKVVPMKEGLSHGTGTNIGNGGKKASDAIATHIVQLKVGVASELAKVLPSLLGKDYAISAYAPSNTLALTAPMANIAKALTFIEQVESSNSRGQTMTFALQHGDAKSMGEHLSKILKGKDEEDAKKGRMGLSLVVADERTNKLIVYGDRETLSMAEATIMSIDIPTPKGKGDVHMITLKNAKAVDLAQVINSLVERQLNAGADKEKHDMVLSKDIKVVADPATNSLVVTARPDEFAALKNIVNRLDTVRKQVYIEALIMEVNKESNMNFGVSWAAANKYNDITGIGGVNLSDSSIILGSNRTASLPSGVSLGAIFSNAFSVGGTSYNIQSILNATRGNADVQVLSTPQLLTLDNEEASVEVVDNIPYTKESTKRNDNDFTTQSMDYKDVGVKLKITPRISDDGALRLEVEQEVSRVTQGLVTLRNGDQIVAPTTRKRTIKSTIRLMDGQTAVIGGLLDDSSSWSQQDVPGFSSIPVLGWLFKNRSKTTARTNLFVFITPKIISSFDESETLTHTKEQAIHEATIDEDGKGLPVMSRPKLLKPVWVY